MSTSVNTKALGWESTSHISERKGKRKQISVNSLIEDWDIINRQQIFPGQKWLAIGWKQLINNNRYAHNSYVSYYTILAPSGWNLSNRQIEIYFLLNHTFRSLWYTTRRNHNNRWVALCVAYWFHRKTKRQVGRATSRHKFIVVDKEENNYKSQWWRSLMKRDLCNRNNRLL